MQETSPRDISGIMVKAACEAALVHERRMHMEITDFVMYTFALALTVFCTYCYFVFELLLSCAVSAVRFMYAHTHPADGQRSFSFV